MLKYKTGPLCLQYENGLTQQSPDKVKSRGEQLLLSAGHIVPPFKKLFSSLAGYILVKNAKSKPRKLAFAGLMWPAGWVLPPPGLETFLSLNLAKL